MYSPWYIVYFVLSIIAIILNLIAIFTFIYTGSLTAVTTRLVLFVHICSLITNISTLPYIYEGNLPFCEFMGATHFYAELASILCVAFLSYVYVNYTFGKLELNEAIGRVAPYIIFSVPFIAFLPFITKGYETDPNPVPWCTLDNDLVGEIWAFAIFYLWAAIVLIYCAVQLTAVLQFTLRHQQQMIGAKLFFSLGIYIILSWISILPRCVFRIIYLFDRLPLTDGINFFLFSPIPLVGIAYSLCLWYNYSIVMGYERHARQESNTAKGFSLEIFRDSFNLKILRLSGSLSHRASASSKSGGGLGDVIMDAMEGIEEEGKVIVNNPLQG